MTNPKEQATPTEVNYDGEYLEIVWHDKSRAVKPIKEIILAVNRHHLFEEMVGILKRFVDNEPCSFDHHGYCQTHGVTMPCINEQAKQLLDTVGGAE
ncbi:MAG: hypothetical protein KGI08_05200 [Thaumarchaeota archaeon]|nr:hypothetical protein [Nitrososphaerota archaeon]